MKKKVENIINETLVDTKVRVSQFFTPNRGLALIISALIIAAYIVFNSLGYIDKLYEISPYLTQLCSSVVWIAGGIFGGTLVDLILALSLRGSQKAITIEKMIHSLLKYLVAIVVLIGLLIVWLGEDYIAGVLGGVGVLALVIGLGAQKLISDILAGVFMVFEGRIKVGDIVSINGWRGTVEEIGVRTTVLLSAEGDRKTITNSNITEIVNMSNELSLCIVTASIHYDVPVEKTCKVVEDNLQRLKDRIPAMKKMPEFAGLDSMADSGYVIKLFGYCNESARFQTQRDMVKELMLILQENEITLAYPHVEISNN